jgi:hypothetical protein
MAEKSDKNAEVKGADQVVKNLSKFEDSVVSEIVKGCEAVQQKVVNRARERVPVVTGNLHDSIQPGGIIVEDDNVTALVLATAPYASYVEGVPDEKGRFGRGTKTPFLGPAIIENQQTFVRAMAAAVKRARAT